MLHDESLDGTRNRDDDAPRMFVRGASIVRPHANATPHPKRLSPQWIIVILWSSVGMANAGLALMGQNGRTETTRVLAASACGMLFSLALSFATQGVIERNVRYRWAVLGCLVLLGGSSLWAIDTILQIQTFGRAPLHWPSWQNFMGLRFNIVYYNLIFTLQTAAQALLTANRTLRARERQLAESRLLAQQAQLAALRFQLNPHFLFNSLNAVATLAAEAGAKDAEEMLDRIADFLRASLSSEPQDFITLENELETVQAYLDIEFVRFGERMNVRYICGAELRDALVPNLILQPLVENAIKYAVAPSTELVRLSILAREAGENLYLEVEDDGHGIEPSLHANGTGVGLKNIADRLKVLYEDLADLQVRRSEIGFTATIRLPLKRVPVVEDKDAHLSGR
jgi:signal transduction histidine kinase